LARRASSGILALEMLVTKVRLSMQYAALSRAMVLSLPIFYAHQRIALMRFFIVPALTASVRWPSYFARALKTHAKLDSRLRGNDGVSLSMIQPGYRLISGSFEGGPDTLQCIFKGA